MTTQTWQVKNVKCGGCASRIREGLAKLAGVEQVEVDIPTGKVTVAGGVDQQAIVNELAKLGYPVVA